MKKIVLLCSFLSFIVGIAAQTPSYSRPTSIGISFLFFDYQTPDRLRHSSLRQVLKNGDWARLNEMSPGLGITFFKGLHPHIDFSSSLAGAFADNALPDETVTENGFVVVGDATLQFNFLSNRYLVTPYLSAGVGASKFMEYYGAFVPVGCGVKVNFFDEAAFFINGKYHLPVTTGTVRPHFILSLGIAGIISKK